MNKTCRCTARMNQRADGTWKCIYNCPPLSELRPKRRQVKPDPERTKGFQVERDVNAAMKRIGLAQPKWSAATVSGMVRNKKRKTP